MIRSVVSIQVDSNRTGHTYEVARFTEYHVSIDLETDTDAFDFVLKNPDGVYSGIFSKFDGCRIYINDEKIIEGNIDEVSYIMTDTDNYIQLSGRDKCWKLVDNDAMPGSQEQVSPKQYIESRCAEFGISCQVSEADVYEKLTIGCGESEISVMNNILLESKQRIWYLVDTLYTGDWNTGESPVHIFTMNGDGQGIPIKTFRLVEDGTDMKSDVMVYGSDSKGGYQLQGTAENAYMKSIGIKKVSTVRQYSDKASSKYTSIADKEIRSSFRNNQECVIDVRISQDDVYMPNTTVQIINDIIGMSALMFVKKVEYSKSLQSGSVATLTTIPADTTFEATWQSDGTSVTNPV